VTRAYILVVEDDTDWQRLLAEIVVDAGFMPVIVTSPKEATNALATYIFSLAIVDISLSFADYSNREGVDILREIAQLSRRLPAVIITGYASIDLNIETLAQVKPVHFALKDKFVWPDFVQTIKKEALPSLAVASLSEREWEVLELMRQGWTNKEIAEALIVTVNTIKKHAQSIFTKLNVNTRAEAVAKAMEQKE
jgi:DNA-binding NarL/FixJ family response regulator